MAVEERAKSFPLPTQKANKCGCKAKLSVLKDDVATFLANLLLIKQTQDAAEKFRQEQTTFVKVIKNRIKYNI